jgi:1-acyl-sn-glycerol-3-phosphate acyltransferase
MLKQPGVITVSIGQPIDCSHLKPDAVNTQVEAWINAETTVLGA